MRRLWTLSALVMLAAWTSTAEATEKSIEDLPGDLARLSLAWTEPVTGAIDGARQVDPVSGVWFGMLEGSVRSVERVVSLFKDHANRRSEPSRNGGLLLLRYSF